MAPAIQAKHQGGDCTAEQGWCDSSLKASRPAVRVRLMQGRDRCGRPSSHHAHCLSDGGQARRRRRVAAVRLRGAPLPGLPVAGLQLHPDDRAAQRRPGGVQRHRDRAEAPGLHRRHALESEASLSTCIGLPLVVTPVNLRPWHTRSSSVLLQAARQGGNHALRSRHFPVKSADFPI